MYKRILVPIDGSPTSNQALATAIRLAQTFGAQLRLVHVVQELAYLSGYDTFGGYPGGLLLAMREGGLKIIEEGMTAASGAGVQADNVIFDDLGERLGETVSREARSWGADLIVVGTHGRRGMGRLLMGSGAEDILRNAPVPVLAVRTPEAGSDKPGGHFSSAEEMGG